jgi:hypothetical protein
MVNFKDPQNVRDIGPAVGEGIESGAEDHVLGHSSLHRVIQLPLDIAASHHDRTTSRIHRSLG